MNGKNHSKWSIVSDTKNKYAPLVRGALDRYNNSVPKILQTQNLPWYAGGIGALTGIGFAQSGLLGIDNPENLDKVYNILTVQFFIIALNKLAGRKERYQETKTGTRGWGANMKMMLDINVDTENETTESVEELIKLKNSMIKLLVLLDSFDNPNNSDLADAVFSEGDTNKEDEPENIIADIVKEIEITSLKIDDTKKIQLVSKFRFWLAPLLHNYASKAPEGKQNTRTAQIDSLHTLIGEYDTNSKEKVKSPEVLFFIMYLVSTLMSLSTKEDTTLYMFYMATMGLSGIMWADYLGWIKSVDAMDYADNPIKTAINWFKQDVLKLTEKLETLKEEESPEDNKK